MFSRKPILLVVFSLLFSFIHAQQVNFIKYSVYDGLVANPIRRIYQDSKGFIWIGTYDGLSRFDGYKFTNYTTSNGPSHIVINSLFEIEGKLLIAENNGAVDVIQNSIIQERLMVLSGVNAIMPYYHRFTPGDFIVRPIINSKTTSIMNVKIIDITGKTVDQIKMLPFESFRFGNSLKPGIYFAEVSQGTQRQMIRLVKL